MKKYLPVTLGFFLAFFAVTGLCYAPHYTTFDSASGEKQHPGNSQHSLTGPGSNERPAGETRQRTPKASGKARSGPRRR